MCGIAGYLVLPGGRPPAPGTLQAMNDALFHRGPDEGGLIEPEGDGVGLAMRRLAIIDLSGGHQPMATADDRIVIVFNGEIYNFGEARSWLLGRGHPLRTRCDTETVLYGWREEGTRCLDRFRGMYAFALWDRDRRELFLARDRLGKKPLHLLERDGVLYFASEIKAFAAAGLLAGVTIDPVALTHYLLLGYIPGRRTIYREIRRLPAGHFLTSRGGVHHEGRYWDIPDPEASARSDGELLEQLGSVLDDAVRLRLISDVPVGALLSGGVDSSLVTALMARHHSGPVRTFTIGFDEPGYDESGEAARVARLLGTDHREERVRLEAAVLLDEVVRACDEPFADTTALPQLVLSRLARRHVTVALSGDGGDELFSGYRRYRRLEHLLRYRALPAPLRAGLRAALGAFGGLAGDRARSARLAAALAGDEFDAWLPGCAMLLPGEVQAEAAAEVAGEGLAAAIGELRAGWGAGGRSGLDAAMAWDIHHYLVDDILAKVDRTSMACSLEVRVPLLDHVLVEAASRIPAARHVSGGRGKHLLRALANRVLPAGIVDRPKHGFTVPVDRWFRDDLAALAREHFSAPDAITAGLLPRGYPNRLLDAHRSGAGRHGEVLWALLVLEMWHRRRTAAPSDLQPALAGPAVRTAVLPG